VAGVGILIVGLSSAIARRVYGRGRIDPSAEPPCGDCRCPDAPARVVERHIGGDMSGRPVHTGTTVKVRPRGSPGPSPPSALTADHTRSSPVTRSRRFDVGRPAVRSSHDPAASR
jgi:hypothetical protein